MKKKEAKETKKVQQMNEYRIKELETEVITKVELNNSPVNDDKSYDVFVSHAYEDKYEDKT
ncbi:hypothetical protein ACQV2T_08895 [Facklamia sp. P13069]|uniref:hypothetical protein n=1 Tax=Facklamia sp. P13069 TaxID=3421954 RepID=UPI003D17CFA0